ncbi:MAG: YeeE/YedE family protein [Desulfuromonadales bacterium]|nr:YeeE/YedE family protein [Desulfuromonadales bacterium]
MEASALIALTTSLTVGLAAGFCMHRSDFCLAGAFRDLFLFRDGRRLRALVLLVTASAVLFELARVTGVLPYYPFPWFAPPATINLIGGCLFGIGMVLAGGCVVGVLYKLGGGSLPAAVAFLGLLAGSALYAEIHPVWILLAKAGTWHDRAATLPQLTGVAPGWWAAGVAIVGGWFCWRWWRQGLWRTPMQQAEGYLPLWVTALVLAGLGLLSVLGTGMPMGVTTSYAKFAAFLEELIAPGHVAQVAYFTAQPILYTLPHGGPQLAGGGGPVLDVVALIQFPLIAGIILGALISALLLREFHPRWQMPGRQVLMVFAGGVIMALGSRMAPGCNVWHLLGGLPLLTMQSLLFLAGLFPGAWLGGRLFLRWTTP